jgi:hypothetical protein
MKYQNIDFFYLSSYPRENVAAMQAVYLFNWSFVSQFTTVHYFVGIHTKFRNNKRHFEYSDTSCLQLQGGTSSTNVSSESGVKEGKLLLTKDSLDKMLKDITQPLAKCQML